MNTLKELAEYCGCTVQAIHNAKKRAEKQYQQKIEGNPDPKDGRVILYSDSDIQKILEFSSSKGSGRLSKKSSTGERQVSVVDKSAEEAFKQSLSTVEKTVEGNRYITREVTALAVPELDAELIDLTRWDGAGVFAIADPEQAVASVDGLLTQIERSFDADLQRRQQELEQTRQAQQKVSDRMADFKIQAELYRRDARMLANQQNSLTRDLSQSLQHLQEMGKPKVGSAATS